MIIKNLFWLKRVRQKNAGKKEKREKTIGKKQEVYTK